MTTIALTLRTVLASIGAVFLAGCVYFVSWDDLMRPLVGTPIANHIKFNGEPTSKAELPDGKMEYRFECPRVDRTCVNWWIVDNTGKMLSYRYVGRCRPVN